MNDIIFRNLSNLGFGNPQKENLWNYCKQTERLEIFRRLHTARSILPVDLIKKANFTQLEAWSTLDYHEIPEEIQPVLFFAFANNNFNAENVHKQINRFYD